MKPCPFCGHAVYLDDADTLYPNGTGWRDNDFGRGLTTRSEKYRRNSGVIACIAPRLVAVVDVQYQVTPNKKLLPNGTHEYERAN